MQSDMSVKLYGTSRSNCVRRLRLFMGTVICVLAALFLYTSIMMLKEDALLRAEQKQKLNRLNEKVVPRVNASCYCKTSDGQLENMCYRLPLNSEVSGKPFDCASVAYLDELELLESRGRSLDYEMLDNPVIVVAASKNHFEELRRLLSNLREVLHELKIIFYDLGLSKEQLIDMEQVCGVEIRRFRFEKFPPHVQSLHEFRWKPLIIAEVLRETDSLWYMDTSIVLRPGNMKNVYDLVRCRDRFVPSPIDSVEARDKREREQRLENGYDETVFHKNVAECRKFGYLLHGYTGHGIYPVTAPGVYDYIPTNFTEIKKPKAKMYEAGLAFVMKMDEAVRSLLKWYVLCALERDCMVPPRAVTGMCQFDAKDRFGVFAWCHRYDQSVINVLLANANYYDRHYYSSEIVNFFKVQREVDDPKKFDLQELGCSLPPGIIDNI